MAYVTNKEKISSSVVRQIMRSVRDDLQLKEVLGEVIRPQPEWWLNGDPLINGRVRPLVLLFALNPLTHFFHRLANSKETSMSVSESGARKVTARTVLFFGRL
jgi:hypothetical protein